MKIVISLSLAGGPLTKRIETSKEHVLSSTLEAESSLTNGHESHKLRHVFLIAHPSPLTPPPPRAYVAAYVAKVVAE